jgi:hypothetical protein
MLKPPVLATFAAVAAILSACSSAATANPDATGQAMLSLTQVPAGVGCLQVTVAGSITVERLLCVLPGQASTY